MDVKSSCSSFIEHEMDVNGKKYKLRSEVVNEKLRTTQRGPWKWLCFLCSCCVKYKRESFLTEVRSIDDQKYTTQRRILNGKATGEEASDTTMTDAEVTAFKKEWDRNWRPGFNTAIITRPFDVLIPVFNETLFS